MERSMHTLQAIPSFFAVPKKALWLMTALICGVVLSLTAATGYALDLVAFAGIAGPLTAALTQLATLAPGVKALIGFIGFVVALRSEERRVGKECRSRWGQDCGKEKPGMRL